MPIVVNPSFFWPPDTEPVVSPDGRITAIVDPAHAGVLLRADFSDMEPVNLAANSDFTSLSRQFGSGTLTAGGSAELAISSDWAVTGSTSLKIGTTGNGWSSAYQGDLPVQGGETFTVSAVIHLTGPLGGGINAESRRIVISYKREDGTGVTEWVHSGQAPNDAGTTTLSVTFTLPNNARSWTARLFHGGESGPPVYWDNFQVVKLPVRPVQKVRFERQDGTLVRSGNPAWAPGGYAHAYDHEATLGGGTLWRAVPIHFDGTEGTPSEYVGAVIPTLSDGWAWLKPVADPNKAMLLKVEPPDLSYDGRVDTTSIAGAARPAATWDVLEGFTTQLRSLVREKPVADQLMALLDEGPVLAQFPACAGLPDFYFIRGKVDLEHVHWDGYPWRRYQWDVVSIDRPDTTDSPLRIPDLSYDTVERDWTTYDQLKSTVVSYNKLLEP